MEGKQNRSETRNDRIGRPHSSIWSVRVQCHHHFLHFVQKHATLNIGDEGEWLKTSVQFIVVKRASCSNGLIQLVLVKINLLIKGRVLRKVLVRICIEDCTIRVGESKVVSEVMAVGMILCTTVTGEVGSFMDNGAGLGISSRVLSPPECSAEIDDLGYESVDISLSKD
jgi:hypothetical protein